MSLSEFYVRISDTEHVVICLNKMELNIPLYVVRESFDVFLVSLREDQRF